MLTYDYYKNVYLGDSVSEDEFTSYLLKAKLEYNNYTRKPKLTEMLLEQNGSGATAIRFTLCEIIDNLSYSKRLLELSQENDLISALGIASEGVKDHSISIKTSDRLKSKDVKEQLRSSNIDIMKKYLGQYGLLYRGL